MKIISLMVSAIGIFLLTPQLVFASTLYLAPGKTTIPVGGTVAISVRLNAGSDPVNAVSAFLSYPADKLDVVYVSPGSVFAIGAENSYGGGTIKISRGSLSGVTGNVNVATIGFRGKTAGAATVSFIGGSSVPRASDSSESLNLGGSAGGTYTIGGTAATPIPVPKVTVKPGQPTPTPDQNSIPLILSDAKTVNISSGSATITWKSSRVADSVVEYGLEKDNYFLSSSEETLVTDHSIKLQSAMMLPGYIIHFRVKSKDAVGSQAQGLDQTFQIPGYQIKIKITDENEKPLKDVEVLLYSDPQRAVTDANGEVTFTNVSADKHLVVVNVLGLEKTFDINVTAVDNPQAGNQFSLKINSATKWYQNMTMSKWVTFAGIIFFTIIILGILFLILRRRYITVQNGPPNN